MHLRNVFKLEFLEKEKRNPLISLRSVSKSIGVSPTTLSDFLNGKKNLSMENTVKLMGWLELSPEEQEYFSLRCQRDLAKDPKVIEHLDEKLRPFHQGAIFKENQEVREFLSQVEVRRQINYVDSSTGKTRTLFLLNGINGGPIKSFYETFYYPSELSGGAGYFIENQDGSFKAYICEQLVGEAFSRVHHPDNNRVSIRFDGDGFPIVLSVKTMQLHTPIKGELSMAFSQEKLIMEGHTFNQNNPAEKSNFKRIYLSC